jgi:hypothetical protein
MSIVDSHPSLSPYLRSIRTEMRGDAERSRVVCSAVVGGEFKARAIRIAVVLAARTARTATHPELDYLIDVSLPEPRAEMISHGSRKFPRTAPRQTTMKRAENQQSRKSFLSVSARSKLKRR